FRSRSSRAASAYQRINVETSVHTMDQHQLVNLLLLGAISAVATARGARARGVVVVQCSAVADAIRIVEEGLTTALARLDGGELAENLGALYDYCVHRLILANARNDDAMFLEVQRLIEPIAQSWLEIRKTGAATAVEFTDSVRPALQEA